ncbi:DUF1697 domain-containing protein [Comamonas testosteroni]|jgi:uncharacterized protein (DUF1697 family)|uniref:DUF1697 domain-containing protein n=1 Tax=Comamonas testosteroni (strain DSM 14576 / KF-1) TaxID=399795 RepID=B7WUT8_COMTK|nr:MULTISPECIES: DUF1697 domain-containing protein [Comamonas]EED67601.1 protein of unknown function DUF1697 [Comamonas testosteroni KF-1]TYK69878.1 DUF1697 domain-containing protein [Comamonas sp. Z3]WQG65744.1 DUF1697 domain-containing protein [Comamonas testosteroni]
MPIYIALLRAVNVGGTGKLPMAELKSMCEAEGCTQVQTYIASGNVVLKADCSAQQLKSALARRLASYAGKPIEVFVRTLQQMKQVLEANPFPQSPGNRAVAIFLEEAPPADALSQVTGRNDEQLQLGRREIYVAYGSGMGNSRLKIPAAASGTARNLNTIAKLVEMAAALDGAGAGSAKR